MIMKPEELIKNAIEARKLSYSPYSHFAVGAIVETKDGKLFKGANVENSSYSLAMCAERNAIYHAMMNGYTKNDFVSLTIVADSKNPCVPCGSCRQVISELFPENAPIYLGNLHGEIKTTTIKEMLPFAFSKEDLK